VLGGAKFILFFSPPAKQEERNPTHITHDLSRFIGIAKAPQAAAKTKALPKSAILRTHTVLN